MIQVLLLIVCSLACVSVIKETEVVSQLKVLSTARQITEYLATETVQAVEYTETTLTLSVFEEEEVTLEWTTEPLGYEVVEEFVTGEQVQLDTLWSGETTMDTTFYRTVSIWTTSTTLITQIGDLAVSLQTEYKTLTEYVTMTKTQFHFTDVTSTRILTA